MIYTHRFRKPPELFDFVLAGLFSEKFDSWSCTKTFTAFCSSTVNDFAAPGSCHSCPETMFFLSAPIVWLESTFHKFMTKNNSLFIILNKTYHLNLLFLRTQALKMFQAEILILMHIFDFDVNAPAAAS